METKPEIHYGLEGVYIAESGISKVDGTLGRLYYRGYSIDTLAQNSSFEEVCYLLLYGKLPTEDQLNDLDKKLKKERAISEDTKGLIEGFADKLSPLDLLRTAVSAAAEDDSKPYSDNEAENVEKAIRIIAKMPTVSAAIWRLRNKKDPIEPDSNLGHSENFLYMLSGEKPNAEKAKFMDVMFIIHAEHSSNASTFATLVACSTLADIYSAVTAGVSTLKGPLHGGADEAAIKMMRDIGDPKNTESYINEALAGKKRIMGFGHRVYKTYDPRARILKAYLERAKDSADEDVRKLIEISLIAEKLMIERLGESHGIWPNVDFFAGPLYLWAGVQTEVFDIIFASSRSLGWCTHIIEYWRNNKLFRPLEVYTGELDLEYVPIERRS